MAGDGPVVLALHESPRSSLSLTPVIEALCGRYRVIAIDTPGYGLSDPLPGDTPQLDDFLDVIGAVLDAIGVKRAALYGTHTGAALATAFALREPDRITALVLDGLSAFTPDEVEQFHARYLVPYQADWDGRHVISLWSRVKDLYTWFPWHERVNDRRLTREPADLGLLHKSALGFLQAGPHYAKAYAHAAAFQPNAVMRDLAAPTTVIARPEDLIADHLDRLIPGPVWAIAALGEGLDDWRHALAAGLAKGETPDAAALPTHADQGSLFVAVGGGWLHAMAVGPVESPVRLVIPGLPGDPAALLAEQARMHPEMRIVVLSPPGCGMSDPLAGGGADLADSVEALRLAAERLNLTPSRLAGQGAGAVIAALLARQSGWRLAVDAIEPPAWLSRGTPLPETPLLRPLPAAWDGSHLTAAWFQLRDLQLYDTPPGAGAPARRVNPTQDVTALDRLFRAYVQGPDCGPLLAQVVEHLRAHPADRLEPAA